MTAISYANACENLATMIDEVCSTHEPVKISRGRGKSVVMLSLEDYESLEESSYLLRSPANARRLVKAIESLEAGGGTHRKIRLAS
jgi:antitoxin YefM